MVIIPLHTNTSHHAKQQHFREYVFTAHSPFKPGGEKQFLETRAKASKSKLFLQGYQRASFVNGELISASVS